MPEVLTPRQLVATGRNVVLDDAAVAGHRLELGRDRLGSFRRLERGEPVIVRLRGPRRQAQQAVLDGEVDGVR